MYDRDRYGYPNYPPAKPLSSNIPPNPAWGPYDYLSPSSSDDEVMQRLKYYAKYHLKLVCINDVTITEGNDEDTVAHVDAYDEDICAKWEGGEMNVPAPTDWTVQGDSTSFKITYSAPDYLEGGRWGCEWDCFITDGHVSTFTRSFGWTDDDKLEAEQLVTDEDVYDYDDYGKHSITTALVAYLERVMEQDPYAILSPLGADYYAEAYLTNLNNVLRDRYRESYEPNVLALCKRARASAEMTPTGIDALDRILSGGLVPGVYTLAGDPSAGKTALAVQVLLYAAHDCGEDERAAYFMCDQGGSGEIAKRLVSLAHAIGRDAKGEPLDGCELSRAATWTDEEIATASLTYEGVSNGRAVIWSLTNGSTKRMTDVLDILTKKAAVHLTLVVVDYYQLLTDVEDGCTVASDPEYASLVMRKLRTWATDHRTPVLLVGQFTKEAIERHRRGNPAEMTDLLGSVDVPYQSEACIMLTNAHDGSGIVTLTDAKHRHAGNASQDERTTRLHLDGEHGYFTEASDS